MAVLTVVLSEVEAGDLPAGAPASTWTEVASRAHSILTQSLPDELLDEISAGHAAHPLPFTLPSFLFG